MCEGEKVCLGAFSIRGPERGPQGYKSAIAITRVVTRMRPAIIAWIRSREFIGGKGASNTEEWKVA